MPDKIFVTGGSGRLGQHAIRELLAHGYDVLSLDRITPPTKLSPSRIADLTRWEDVCRALEGADAIIHLGAYPAPGLAPGSNRGPAEPRSRSQASAPFPHALSSRSWLQGVK